MSDVDEAAPALLQRFVTSGYVQLPPSPSVPASAHAEIQQSILRCGLQEAQDKRDPYGLRQLDGDAAGNNLLHAAPALRGGAFLEHPGLMITLRAHLGPGWRLHPHCRGHLRQRSAKTSMWHVDAYKGLPWCSGRHHEPHWVMVMYYPQATTMEMGPTELLPGTQYLRGDSDRQHYSRGHIPEFGRQMDGWATAVHSVVGPAGTVVVMHYDLWHRALASASDSNRLMLKFVACRTAPPPRRAAPAPAWPLLTEWDAAAAPDEGRRAAARRAALLAREETILECVSSRGTGGSEQPIEQPAEPSSAGVRDGGGGGGGGGSTSDPLPAEVMSLLSAHLESHAEALCAGLDLLDAKASARAEKALFASSLGVGRASVADGSSGLRLESMPSVVRWLAPLCRARVQRAADIERSTRFVADRLPVWRHVWAWLHGREAHEDLSGGGGCDGWCGGGCEVETGHGPSGAEREECEVERLRRELLSGPEPSRLRAAYELGCLGGGGRALLRVLTTSRPSTSVRRVALYGAVAAGATSSEQLAAALEASGSEGGGGGGDDGGGGDLGSGASPEGGDGHEEAEAEAQAPSLGRDPITCLPVASRARWISATLVRAREGFDAECLLAAASPHAEAAYHSTLVCARGDRRALDGRGPDRTPQLLRALGPPPPSSPSEGLEYTAPPSARLVCLEALGWHAARSEHAPRAVALLASSLACECTDAGTRAVAARALAQLAAQGTLGAAAAPACRMPAPGGSCAPRGPEEEPSLPPAAEWDGTVVAAVAALAAALEGDPDRYVRGYSADALASLLLLEAAAGGASKRAALERAEQALTAAISQAEVAEAVRRARRTGADADAGDETTGETDDDPAHGAVRWLCARRRCPLTSPRSPF